MLREIGPLLSQYDRSSAEALRAAHEKCPAGPPRTLLALWLDLRVPADELDALLADGKLASLSWDSLHTRDPAQRAALVRLVTEDESPERALRQLSEGRTVLEPEHLEALAGWFIEPTVTFDILPRKYILELFSYAAQGPDGAARTRRALAVLARAKPDPLFDAARVTLGERDRLAAAVKHLKPNDREFDPSTTEDLVHHALMLAGCPHIELNAVAHRKQALPRCVAP